MWRAGYNELLFEDHHRILVIRPAKALAAVVAVGHEFPVQQSAAPGADGVAVSAGKNGNSPHGQGDPVGNGGKCEKIRELPTEQLQRHTALPPDGFENQGE